MEPSEEEDEEEEKATILTPKVGKFLVLKRVLHVIEV